MASISINGLSKQFGSVPVLRRVDLQVRDGEFLTLVGPSGCGKTTLLRIIAGLDHADAGHIQIGDQLVDALAPKQRDVAMVFQSYALYPYMTVEQNIALPLIMRRMSALQRLPLIGARLSGSRATRQAIANEVRAVADSLGLLKLLMRKPAQLSGGQRQRVALARAMVRRPQVFLMDEPLSNLDAKLRAATRTEIAELHRRLASTFIYVTHDQVEAMTMSDRVALMIDGQILQLDTPQEIYDNPIDVRVAEFIGTPKINVLTAVREADGLRVCGALWPIALADQRAAGSNANSNTNSDSKSGVNSDTSYFAAVRPEWWTLHEAPNPAETRCVVRGVVRFLEVLGSETLVHVAVEGQAQPLVAKLEPERARRLRIGAAVTLSTPAARVLIFGDDGQRVAKRSGLFASLAVSASSSSSVLLPALAPEQARG